MCSSGFGAAKKLSLCSRFGFSAPRCMGSSPTHRYSPHYSYNRMNQVPQAARNATSGQLMSLLSARETCNLKSRHLLLRRSSFSICLPSFVGFLSFFLFFQGRGLYACQHYICLHFSPSFAVVLPSHAAAGCWTLQIPPEVTK